MKLDSRVLQGLQVAALAVSLLAIVSVGLAGPANKFEVVDFRTALGALKWGAYLGIGGAVLALVAAVLRLVNRRPVFWCALALVLGGVATYFPVQMMNQAKAVPPIHDISTDLRAPLQFVALAGKRGKDANPLDYDEAVAAQQQKAYPDIEPLVLQQPLDAAWQRALAAAKTMGWEIVAIDQANNQIEATDTTEWFGFKDDVVIHVHQIDPGQSRVDMRSVSRVGRSDLGVNAARVRKYLKAVQAG